MNTEVRSIAAVQAEADAAAQRAVQYDSPQPEPTTLDHEALAIWRDRYHVSLLWESAQKMGAQA